MTKRAWPVLLPVCLLLLGLGVTLAAGGQQTPLPITQVNVQQLGPQRLGPLPPVVAPPGNPPSSAKIHLGKQLYFDTRLSSDNTVACATCHDPARGWSDAGPTSKGIRGQMGGRRAPPVSNAAYSPLQFWDGRAPSLEEQAKGPIQNPIEMGNTHEVMIRSLDATSPVMSMPSRRVYGEGPMTVQQVADAIAAFERTVVTTDSRFDRYVRGDHDALTPLERQGLEIFNGKGHCTACHWGPYFSDGRFHNLGVTEQGSQESRSGTLRRDEGPARHGRLQDPYGARRGVARSLPAQRLGAVARVAHRVLQSWRRHPTGTSIP